METSTKGFLDQHKDKGMKANRDKWKEKQKKDQRENKMFLSKNGKDK